MLASRLDELHSIGSCDRASRDVSIRPAADLDYLKLLYRVGDLRSLPCRPATSSSVSILEQFMCSRPLTFSLSVEERVVIVNGCANCPGIRGNLDSSARAR